MSVIWSRCAMVAGLLAISASASGEDRRPSKVRAAWEWTIEERVAARFDPDAARLRARAASAGRPDGSFVSSGPDSALVDGARNPELLMPWEMLDLLFPIDERRRPEVHARWRGDIERLGWSPEAFWSVAEPIARDYVELVRVMLQDDSRAAADPLQDGRELAACALRARTLEKLRTELGPGFDRLLYEAVAPTISVAGGAATPDAAQLMLFIARGCR